ncbi:MULTISPECIES: DNA replication/repair protein RecF [Salimicrobium]|uniref:DNA replication and repair protein RecF n=3 Tax=Salimicrobium TaxID=351195 RepID=K2H6X1_9BACI|nr:MULTISPECIES: DNA replication/repair protein RecF [Salimicrobium]AKG03320.1 DNA replication/repair protein RecF [Salimicrobium jeotgali]EKE31480.1 recombination protein F [Salimicrobium jeotgali]MBM7696731.1 DNA replication and repair protein RecF [Salimicrobium jeotgali]SDY34318.1 DNA replication and repair protein RecF [Salimicrobium album]SIS91721.1 DNA replication and repair protein RecF [Salimicrobium salexigens]
MHIKDIALTTYRNYDRLALEFDDTINVIIGENAQGKTNLMESIYLLAFTKSHRTPRDKELIQWDAEYAKIKGTIIKRNSRFPMEIVLSKKGKKAKLNHIEQRRLSDYIGALNVVMFAPEDLNLVKGNPQVRRRFIDMEIGQIQPRYIYHLGQYQKVLRQRNHLLKDLQRRRNEDATMLHVLTEQLIEHAAIIVERRFQFLNLLREWAAPIHRGISRELEKLEIFYRPSLDVSEDMDLDAIKESYIAKFHGIETKEIERGTTLAGPHRDDLVFYVNGRDVQTYGSQGQQRTTALSLKLAEIELINKETGEYPVLLLDDVLSELDDYRQSHLLHTIRGKVQTFVSTTSIDGIEHEALQEAELFYIEEGIRKK